MTTTTATPSTQYVPIPVRFDFDTLAPAVAKAVAGLHRAVERDLAAACVDRQLIELVRLRASQLNGCAYCVDMHARDARAAGADPRRVDAVAVWTDSGFFTAAERAALALAESVTRASETHVSDAVVREALDVLGEAATAAVLGLIVSINTWNRIGATARCWPLELGER
jgi:AhpD family alkylhydroperoxidase